MERLLRLFSAKKRLKLLIAIFFIVCNLNPLHAQVNWVGGVSSDYFNVNNWSDNTIVFSNIQSATLVIGAGNSNNPVLTGGNASNVNYRPGYVNTKKNANFTVNGNLYCWNSDSLNGLITLNSPADFNVRNIAYVGRNASATLVINGGKISSRNAFHIATGTSGSSATVTLSAGAIYAGTDLNIASPAGTSAQVNVSGGAVYVPGNLNIGSGGSVFISGIGLLSLTGNKVAVINDYITAGKISCTAGKTLSVVYDNANTIVSIPQNPNSMLREYPEYVILKNDVLEARIDKNTSNITSLKINGVETVNTAGTSRKGTYYDFTTSKGFETIFGATFSVKRDEDNIVDVSFKRPYKPGSNATPCDADIHYVLKKGDTGIYTYSILEHKAEYPQFDQGSWRQVLWIAPDAANPDNYLCEKIYVDDLRSWQMPSIADFSQAAPTGIAEIVKLTTGVRAGKYDGKYEYTAPFWETPVWGHASDVNKIGTWFVHGSQEFFNEGPTYHELNAAAGIIHSCMNGVHYNAKGMVVPQGEYWTKIYGPYLIYASLKNTGDENWADAKARAAVEKAEWPYIWLTNTPQYPLANERGAVTGKFIINDPFKPNVKGQNAWVGVTIISNPSNQWQFEEKNYHYWVKTDADGNFTIPNVRPGTNYTFFGYSDGAVGDYSIPNVSVTAGATTNLGNVTWNVNRSKGNLVWEIGYPNRKANEYKFGDFDYAEGFIYNKFASTFPSTIEYNVAEKNWAEKLSYTHSPYLDANGNLNTWKWRLNFTLPANAPTTGNATLTIAYASSDHSNQFIYVNDESKTFTTFYPDNGGGNAFVRQANYAKYATREISIPMSKLRPGANTITLLMASTQAIANHVMYDYISLEAPVDVALPVSLVSYNAVEVNNRVKLAWETSSEKDNARFDIERSGDNKNYSLVASVKGQGTSLQKAKYEVFDTNPLPGNNYYRLIQYDNNGTSAEQGVRVVKFNGLKEKGVQVYPNPSEGVFNLSIPEHEGKEIVVSIYDLSGRMIFTKVISDSSLSNTHLIDLGFKQTPGEYLLKVKGTNLNLSEKLIFK